MRKRVFQRILRKATHFTKSVSSDWLFNAAIVECLTENGKGIAIMTGGSAWNTMDKPAGTYFIENGYLEAVIALPEKLFEGTGIFTWYAEFRLRGSPDTLDFLYQTGLGSRNSQGFGMFDGKR